MITFTLPGKSLFGGAPTPQALPPLPTREDPSIAAAKEANRLAAQKRRGRAANILTAPQGALAEQTNQPRAASLGA